MALVYEDRTGVLKKMFYDVQNEVGLGRHEEAYHQACMAWLDAERIPYKSKWPHALMLGDQEAYALRPDLVVWDEITVELKAVPRMTSPGEMAQLFDYLKCRRDRVGFLVNMGLDRVVDHRVVYEPPHTRMVENWSYWEGVISGRRREIGGAIRDGLRLLYQRHETGYGREVMERLIPCAISLQGLRIARNPMSTAYFRGQVVGESPLECLVVEDQLLVVFTALFENLSLSVNRGLSYMRALGLEWGVAVDFGKTTARLLGLRQRVDCRAN